MITFPCTIINGLPSLTTWASRPQWNNVIIKDSGLQRLGSTFEGFVLDNEYKDIYYLTTRNVIYVDSFNKMTVHTL